MDVGQTSSLNLTRKHNEFDLAGKTSFLSSAVVVKNSLNSVVVTKIIWTRTRNDAFSKILLEFDFRVRCGDFFFKTSKKLTLANNSPGN